MYLKGPKYVSRIVTLLADSGENCPVRYHSSGNKNICQVTLIGKWKVCCACDNGQDFGNFEEWAPVSRHAI